MMLVFVVIIIVVVVVMMVVFTAALMLVIVIVVMIVMVSAAALMLVFVIVIVVMMMFVLMLVLVGLEFFVSFLSQPVKLGVQCLVGLHYLEHLCATELIPVCRYDLRRLVESPDVRYYGVDLLSAHSLLMGKEH